VFYNNSMTSHDDHGSIPLPEPENYAEIIEKTIKSKNIRSYDYMERAVAGAIQMDARYKRFLGFMAHVAMFMEPIDGTTNDYIDEEQKIAEAVTLGTAFAGLIVPELHGDTVKLDELRINTPTEIWESDDTPRARNMLADYLSEFGNHGLSVMGERAEDLLEDAESRIIADVTKQRLFRIGCGIVVSAARWNHLVFNETHELSNIDWDAGLSDLVAGGGQ
jgi:hypothetical protein